MERRRNFQLAYQLMDEKLVEMKIYEEARGDVDEYGDLLVIYDAGIDGDAGRS